MTDQVLKGDSSLADEIVQILRSRIINGEYSSGEKLVENRIAEELKVSRTPVREAFKQLTKENLVDYVPNKGCYAKGFEHDDLQDIYAVRNAVEQLAVEWAIRNGTEEELARLREQLDEMARCAADNETDAFLLANEEFNKIMYQMTRSRFIMQALSSYQDFMHLARQGLMGKQKILQAIQEENRCVYDAVEAGNIEAAKKAVEQHLRNSAKRAADRWL